MHLLHHPKLDSARRLGLVALLAACEATATDTSAIDAEFDAMDLDGDDRLSPQEHSRGAREMFEAMDADADGEVTAAEMEAASEAITGGPADADDPTAEEKIAVIDGDGDGVLSAAEHAAGAESMFAAMDSDADGFLSRAELAAGHEAML
jgi:hypothetical protein